MFNGGALAGTYTLSSSEDFHGEQRCRRRGPPGPGAGRHRSPASLTSPIDIDGQRAAVVRLESVGYRTVWTNETVGGKDALVQLAVLLAATRRTVFGTGIANVWAREPETLHGAASVLAQAYPGRFVLGIGGGYPQQATATGREFGSPLSKMRDYLDRMDGPTMPPAPDAPYPRIIAANGPKMLALAA